MGGATPRVTVIIPTFNRAQYLPGAVASVLGQPVEDICVLICDNASDDGTADVARGFADDRIRYVRHDRNIGWTANFNSALDAVDTPYFVILGDDDLMYPEMLVLALDLLKVHPEVALVHAPFDLLGPEGEVLRRNMRFGIWYQTDVIETGRAFIRESMVYGCRVCSSTAVWRTAALGDLRYDSSEAEPADFALYLRLALRADIAYVAHTLAGYRVHGSSLTSGVGTPEWEGYRMSWELIEKVRNTKVRFLEEHGAALPDIEQLRQRIRKGTCWDIANSIRTATSPERQVVPTLRMLSAGVRLEPRLVVDPGAWRIVGGSILGQGLVDRIKGATGRR